MDSLLASAGPIEASSSSSSSRTSKPRKPLPHQTVNRGPTKASIDPSLHSILPSTRLSSSLQSTHVDIKPSPHLQKIGDKKLRAKLANQSIAAKRAEIERGQVQEYLNNTGEDGGIEVDLEAGERTWRVSQKEIVEAVGEGSGGKRFDLKLDVPGGGGYRVDYTRNGRHLAIASSAGHVATFDWQAGKLHSEIQLGETVRDIKFLHSEAFYAVAQKKYVFVYDQDGVEVHKMKQHLDVTRMEFLPYHYLLATVGNQGILRYHDTSTGTMVAEHKSRMGSVQAMAQNRHNAIIHLGHQNGQVTLWSPSMSTPHVKLLAHMGPVQSISVDPSSSSCGRYMSTSGADGSVKIWDCRNWGKTVREWNERGHGHREVDWSMKGMLAVSTKGAVNVYRECHSPSVEGKASPPRLYQKLDLPARTPRGIRFVPFEDVLGVGHDAGFSSLLVPGSGLAQFDSNEADVYESKTRRREREVRGVLEKIKPDLITLDADFLGRMADPKKEAFSEKDTPFYKKPRVERLRIMGKSGEEVDAAIKAEQEEAGLDSGDEAMVPGQKLKVEKLKHKMRGRDKGVKKFLRKKRKNVIDPALVAAKEKVQNQKAKVERERKIASGEIKVETGALARFG